MIENHRQSKRQWFLLFLWALFLIQPSSPLFADEASRRQASRTALLKNATGDPTANAANPGYQAYINSVLDLNTDAAQNVTNREFAPSPTVTPLVDPYLMEVGKDKTPQLNDKNKLETKVDQKSALQKPADVRIRSDEDSYQYERSKAERLYEEAQKNQQNEAGNLRKNTESESPESKNSNLRPSLANNPFYFSDSGTTDYSETKTLMTSRLVQMGYTRLEAQNLFDNTSSPEDAVLALMQKEGFSYGDATNIVGTSQSSSAASGSNKSSDSE